MKLFEEIGRAVRMLGVSNAKEPDKARKPGLNGKEAALVFTIVMVVLTAFSEWQRRASVVEEPVAGPRHDTETARK